MQALLGLALVGGAALMGRGRSAFGAPTWSRRQRLADEFSDLAFEAKDAGFMAYVWFDYGADDEGADPCSVRNKYFLALDRINEARRFARKHGSEILQDRARCKRLNPRTREMTYLPQSWGGGDDPDEKDPNGACEEFEAAVQWLDDAFYQITDAKNTYERGCPGRTLPDVWKQTLNGLAMLGGLGARGWQIYGPGQGPGKAAKYRFYRVSRKDAVYQSGPMKGTLRPGCRFIKGKRFAVCREAVGTVGTSISRDDLKEANRLRRLGSNARDFSARALDRTSEIGQPFRDGSRQWWKTGQSADELRCLAAKRRHGLAVEKLSESRGEIRGALPDLVKRNQCKNDGTSFIDRGRNHRICQKLEQSGRALDTAYENLRENRRRFNKKVDDGLCELSIPSVPLSGLDKLITKQMTPEDYIDELVFRVEQFHNAKELTFRELYNEADMDEPNAPSCDDAVESYLDMLEKRKESREAMRAPHIPKLVKRCGNPHSRTSPANPMTWNWAGEGCRRWRSASRRHDDTERSMKSLHRQVEKHCRKVPKPRQMWTPT